MPSDSGGNGSNGIFRIGVATAARPEGPFVAQPQPLAGSYSIDPAVFSDVKADLHGQSRCPDSVRAGHPRLESPRALRTAALRRGYLGPAVQPGAFPTQQPMCRFCCA